MRQPRREIETMRGGTALRRDLRRAARALPLLALPLAAALASGPARADEAADKARAQQLFLEGRKAIDAGDTAGGCAKMRESVRLFAVGNSLFNVAQCDEGEGRIASALEHWERGRALLDAKDPRGKVAATHLAALDPRVPRLRIVVPAGQVLAGVALDGVELSPGALATPLRVEPGKHVIVVRKEGHEERRHELVLAERERTEVVATPGPVAAAPAPPALAAVSPAPPNGRRLAGFVVGGVGLAGLVAAGVTGGLVLSAKGALDPCRATRDCPTADVSRYQSLLVGNTVAFGVGLAGAAAGLVLVLTAPSAKDEKPAAVQALPLVLPGGAGVGLSGRF